ncbi:MAG: acyl-CoA dehydrogenase [Rhodospirillales bacterium]|nr:MAG: acyl-CoA dehydrogenase [Rhodospirillales bacterium]
MTYAAPIADMRFVVHDLGELARVHALPGFEETTPDLVDAVLEEAGKFAAEVLAPLNEIGDRQHSVFENGVVRTPEGFKEAYAQFVAGGWNSVPFDPEYGGQGLPWLVATAVSEIWHAANMSFGLCPMLTQASVELLDAYGTDTLKGTFLPKLVEGTWTGTMNLTEPQAGSDLARVRTKAIPDNGAYRIVGQKIFITWGEHDMAENIVHMVLARLPDAPDGVRGLSLFLVPKFMPNPDGSCGVRNDLRCISIEHKLGIRASPTAVMSFGDDGGAVGYLIGEENHGLEHMFLMMNNARLAVGLEGVGIGDRAYQLAHAYAMGRVQARLTGSADPDPVTIIHHPDVQRMLLTMKSQVEAARALAYFVAASLDVSRHYPEEGVRAHHDGLVALLTPVVKAWSTDVGIEVADLGIQVHGGMGYIEESGAPQHLRDARIASIYEGTNGIQANDLVGRKVARNGGATARDLIALMRELDGPLGQSANEHLRVIRRELSRAIDELEAATVWVVQTNPKDPRAVAMGAYYYLRLMGTVAGGWMLARSAVTALRKLSEADGDPNFLHGKVLTARFFADHFLVRSEGLKRAIIGGGWLLQDFVPEDHL